MLLFNSETLSQRGDNDAFHIAFHSESEYAVMHVGAMFNQRRVIELLLEAKFDVDVLGVESRTALHEAMIFKRNSMSSFLIAIGANVHQVDKVDKVKMTPLHFGAKNNLEDITAHLLQGRAFVNATDMNGDTSLALAAKHGSTGVVKILLDSKWNADMFHENHSKRTAMDLATNCEVIERFLGSGCSINNPSRRAALISAMHQSHVDAAQLLIDRGVDIHSIDHDNTKAIDHAIIANLGAMISALMTVGAKPALKWDEKSRFIAQWKGSPWFPCYCKPY